jgi:hypothetical protein
MKKYLKLRRKVNHILNVPDSPLAIAVQSFIALLIIISCLLAIFEIVSPDFAETHKKVIPAFEITIGILFIIEYGLRLWASEARLYYLISYYSIVDLLAILPMISMLFNMSALSTSRFMRLIRMFRLFRLAKFSKYYTSKLFHIMRENVVKNLIIIIILSFAFQPIKLFMQTIPSSSYRNLLTACSILNLAAMFGLFSFSYEHVNPFNAVERILSHVTTGMLFVPLGFMFIVIQNSLSLQLSGLPSFFIIAIWFVYMSLIIWDFWNVKKIETSENYITHFAKISQKKKK